MQHFRVILTVLILSTVVFVIFLKFSNVNSKHISTDHGWDSYFVRISNLLNVYKAEKSKINKISIEGIRRKFRHDWNSFLLPCRSFISWNYTDLISKRHLWTSVKTSIISHKDTYIVGEWGTIRIYSCTNAGHNKTQGGDSWRAVLVGKSREALDVLDNNDGSYDILFRLYDVGNYSLQLTLEFSMCNGIRDPPEYWFRKGNSQGKYQKEGVITRSDECRHERMKQINFQVIGSDQRTKQGERDPVIIEDENRMCRFIWDGFGRWKDGKWVPYRRRDAEELMALQEQETTVKLNTLWIYGDSLGVYLHRSIMGHPLCKKIFKKCLVSYSWLYPYTSDAEARTTWDTADFNETRALEPIYKVLYHKDMEDRNSLLLINVGLHFVMTISFEKYKHFLQSLIKMIINKRKSQSGKLPRVIWKTTTMHMQEKTCPAYVVYMRFLTLHRVQLFNAYAISLMCKHGIEILDVYQISAAAEFGMEDRVHFKNLVFKPVENMLLYSALEPQKP